MSKQFAEQVYKELKRVPRGKVTTYGDLAKRIGRPKAARAVGTALHKNPYAPQVPCHRVLKSDGGIGGFAEGIKVKIKILKSEGVEVRNGRVLNFECIRY